MRSVSQEAISHGQVINLVSEMVAHGVADLESFGAAVSTIVDKDLWRQHWIPQWKKMSQAFDSFEEFVTTSPPHGLGTTVERLRRLCFDDPRARDALDRVTQRRGGRPSQTLANRKGYPSGTTEAAALRRLRKDRPDLHARVLNGELSAHAAAVQAGFRKPTASVPVDSADSAIQALRRRFTDDELREALDAATKKDAPPG